MTIPLRLDDDLVAAAAQVGSIQKRTTRKQIEFWAELGKAVEPLLDITDVYAIIQGLKKINVEPVISTPVPSKDVFNSLENSRKSEAFLKTVAPSPFYYEASLSKPGLLDKVAADSGKRQTGRFHNGEFKTQP
jgi:hypothetical protein